jgi:hypothetical protein
VIARFAIPVIVGAVIVIAMWAVAVSAHAASVTGFSNVAAITPGYVIRLGKFSREPQALTIDHERECAVSSDTLTAPTE